ncbi:PA4642 family protein [Teredinibacter haidensis]|uniref:PA4642 family protein n=1 Tax=Teredinibacter haidensis TaxID=2731755 RepID=UPI0009490FCF|nr:PA4642 family protein [Teredinibacter haidensis]
MSLKKDKQKVLGEVFDDERVRSFLTVESHDEMDVDYIALERAYRGMKSENFSTFVKFFVEEGRNINAKNPQGKTLLQVISDHRLGRDYIKTLEAAGAKF